MLYKSQDVVSFGSFQRVYLLHEYLLAFTHPTVFEKIRVVGPDIFSERHLLHSSSFWSVSFFGGNHQQS